MLSDFLIAEEPVLLTCLVVAVSHVSQSWVRMTLHCSDIRGMLPFSVICLMMLYLVVATILDHMQYACHSLLSYVL